MNKRKSLLLTTLIIVGFATMYTLLSIASRKALLDFGAILGKSRMLINNLIIGLILAVIPYELIYARITGWFSELFEEKDAEKLHIWASVILIIINVILGVFACVVRHNTPFYMGSTNRKFQYVMLLFICLCIGIIISCRKIENRPVRCIIRSFATALNAFLMIYITRNRNMAQAIIIVFSMTVFILVYDGIICKRLNWKEVVATVLVGITGTVAGLLAKKYYYLVEPDSLEKLLVSFDKVDLYLGFGGYILFIAIAVSMVMVLGFSSKSMANNSPVRSGFLMGAASLFACTFVYIFLTTFDIIPYVETQFITSRVYVVALILILRCFIIIPVPEKEEKTSFIDRVLNSKSEDDDDDDFDWIADKIEYLMKNQNTIIEYVCVLDLKIQELINESCEDEKVKRAKLREIEDARVALKEEGVPMDMNELVAKFNEISEKYRDRKIK